MINFQNVSKKYNDQLVLEDFDVSIEDGEFFVLVGPSGSGKTTTLKMINRLIEPTDGDIYFNEQRLIDYNLKELRLTIGYVLQQIALFPNLTVAENIELIPEMKHWSKAKRRERTEELLRKVSLPPEEYLHRKPAELSGGEQQRIGILRAIAAKPDIILMDEPFSALDPISKGQLQLLIKELHKELASTVVFVTHDMNEALLLGDRICVMKDGKIVQTDTPEAIKSHPANEFVAQFFQHEHANLENYCAEDLVAAGFVEDGQVESETTVNLGTDLPTVIRILVEGKTVVLVDEDGPIGEITDRTILRFLETKIEGDQ
ncbi:glycine betaine/carnitine/choline ABC transporter ATP-binding protein [Enterococcus haemoperoxidus ATCC BAA-382]|uniref:ABC-type quaternary amine transporter n=1 Tax=Enterococcus haemoperoxidus ATCC BAA-382 TaxID=1158608 RepID=R2SIR0_9ENTE|nr:ABC transporter ATP-binding protein [Enterococcus haemoperoxidus]EOH95100.1 glycine betaine/carnitine/choline ABC transporter ATP-binding protein [Enterococcus haemoperoxidus ATCC BAA-382]EOT60499.1 glycine betaine/carnitine/choline ABC transporter ATP-binding protein [Enterococcus haemoperoxidus ATCC BAA-382]OJG54931.1 glycine betaine/carnitine/choline ABC transporter ATP-binding protein [Enterococcus haemoperoxidus]